VATVKPALALLALLTWGPLWALDADRDQPIEVEADSLEVREQENISIYQGNVKLKQGSLEISSDRLVIHFNDNSDLVLMEMTGNPARLRQLDNEQQEMRGQARQINYLESESLLELIEEARFTHAGDTIESTLIRINTEDNNIQAGSSNADERVKMLIQPRQNSTNTE
jgi:lipopolysaccharide export system protein LptA